MAKKLRRGTRLANVVGELVCIEWVDAMGKSEWVDVKGFDMELGKCETIGRLISVDRNKVCVFSNRCKTNSTMDHVMCIPRSSITSTTVLGQKFSIP